MLLDQEETRSMKTGKRVTQRYSRSPIFFNLYSKYIVKEGLEGFADLCVDFIIIIIINIIIIIIIYLLVLEGQL